MQLSQATIRTLSATPPPLAQLTAPDPSILRFRDLGSAQTHITAAEKKLGLSLSPKFESLDLANARWADLRKILAAPSAPPPRPVTDSRHDILEARPSPASVLAEYLALPSAVAKAAFYRKKQGLMARRPVGMPTIDAMNSIDDSEDRHAFYAANASQIDAEFRKLNRKKK